MHVTCSAHIPVQVTPDQAVQYEALLAGTGLRSVWGVAADSVQQAVDALGAPPHATLSLVLDMLLPDEAGRQAAAAVEQCVLVSWLACGLVMAVARNAPTAVVFAMELVF